MESFDNLKTPGWDKIAWIFFEILALVVSFATDLFKLEGLESLYVTGRDNEGASSAKREEKCGGVLGTMIRRTLSDMWGYSYQVRSIDTAKQSNEDTRRHRRVAGNEMRRRVSDDNIMLDDSSFLHSSFLQVMYINLHQKPKYLYWNTDTQTYINWTHR